MLGNVSDHRKALTDKSFLVSLNIVGKWVSILPYVSILYELRKSKQIVEFVRQLNCSLEEFLELLGQAVFPSDI